MAIIELESSALFNACDLKQFKFKTTAELPELEEVVGQERAVEAIRFGIGIKRNGYNLYALGPERSGKRSVISRFIEQQAMQEPPPPDWCYIFNFNDQQKPNAISLPAGRAVRFEKDMAEQVAELGRVVPSALETDEYQERHQEIEDSFIKRQAQAFEKLHQESNAHDMAMLRTPTGFIFAPRNKKGETIEPDEFKKLSKRELDKIEETVANLQERLETIGQQIPKWRREVKLQIKELDREVVMSVVGQLLDELRHSYGDLPEVLEYLDLVQQDIIEHADKFRSSGDSESSFVSQMFPGLDTGEPFLSRYRVNVIIDNSETPGAPVAYMDHPTYANLVGRVEHQAQMGALVTDFTMIKSGALHKSNGGYLILDAAKVLTQPYAWEGLKRVLKSGEIHIESLGQALSLISTTSLDPEPIPLDIKVVLLGDRLLYYLLSEYDPEFGELFKVAADFDNAIERSPGNINNFALFIASMAKKEDLRPLNADAVARVIEEASRQVEDTTKLSSRFGVIADFLREADYWADQAGNKVVGREEVDQAIKSHEHRLSRIKERLIEETLRNTFVITTEGEEVSQINGLSITRLGDYAFGHPNRITATVHVGKGELVDIEREIEMGGPIHSKGVLILGGYISGRYCKKTPLSLSASLVFEQTYGGVEGDSASSAELFVLLSALAEVPIKQSLAVTGSVNQHGQIQAVGGVNEKIEGFFIVCNKRGLNGEQGVIIPRANVEHLMLREDVVKAVSDGMFHIYTIDTVDDGIEILTGVAAGEKDADGNFPDGSINHLVEARLQTMAEQAHEHGKEESEDK